MMFMTVWKKLRKLLNHRSKSKKLSVSGVLSFEIHTRFIHELLCLARLFVDVAESAPYSDVGDENIEEEFMKLEMELESESSHVKPATSDTAESLTEMFSELKLGNTKQTLEEQATEPVRMKDGGKKILEAA